MRFGRRMITSLIGSILLSAALLLLERATSSQLLFELQFPGFFACVCIWGVHSGPDNPALGVIVFGAANALVYWPVCLGLSFLFRRKSPKLRDLS